MVTLPSTSRWMRVLPPRRKDPLPLKRAPSRWILPAQRIRYRHPPRVFPKPQSRFVAGPFSMRGLGSPVLRIFYTTLTLLHALSVSRFRTMPRFPSGRPAIAWLQLLLIGALACVVLILAEAYRAARSSHEVAERALRDYADFAAWSYRQQLTTRLRDAVDELLGPVNHGDALHTGGTNPDAGTLAHYLETDPTCQCHRPQRGPLPARYLGFTLGADTLGVGVNVAPTNSPGWLVDPPGGMAHTVPAIHYPPDETRWINALLSATVRQPRPDWGYNVIVTRRDAKPRFFATRSMPTYRGDTIVYAVEYPQSAIDSLLEAVYQAGDLLPKSLMANRGIDSVLNVAVSDASGEPLFVTAPDTRWDLDAEARVPESFGGLRIRAQLRWELADAMLIGGLPESRVPLLVALLALAIGLSILAAAQLRREVRFAGERANFVANVSHELRTPLSQVRLVLDTQRRRRARGAGVGAAASTRPHERPRAERWPRGVGGRSVVACAPRHQERYLRPAVSSSARAGALVRRIPTPRCTAPDGVWRGRDAATTAQDMLMDASPSLRASSTPDADDRWFTEWRARELRRLDRDGLTYLDYTGAALYPESLVRADAERLVTTVFGNPHSEHAPSRAATTDVESARSAILEFLHADPEQYTVVLTANATAACRLVGESFAFTSRSRLLLTADNHNSVNGLREFARARGARVIATPLDEELRLVNPMRWLATRPRAPSLFAFPGQSNFSGVRHPLELVSAARAHGWSVLLDAASLLHSADVRLDRVQPDFLALSLYKIAGYPTGLGALVARREALAALRRPWFAGGTVLWVSVERERHRLGAGAMSFEDGTPAFLAAGAAAPALAAVQSVDRERLARHLHHLAQLLIDGLGQLRHRDGTPLVRLHGPATSESRGATVAVTLSAPYGQAIPYWVVEDQARDAGIAVRGGCFCNPGCAEAAFGLGGVEASRCLDDLGDEFSVPRFAACLDHRAVGAIRLSLGLGSVREDVRRVLRFLERYVDRLWPQGGWEQAA